SLCWVKAATQTQQPDSAPGCCREQLQPSICDQVCGKLGQRFVSQGESDLFAPAALTAALIPPYEYFIYALKESFVVIETHAALPGLTAAQQRLISLRIDFHDL